MVDTIIYMCAQTRMHSHTHTLHITHTHTHYTSHTHTHITHHTHTHTQHVHTHTHTHTHTHVHTCTHTHVHTHTLHNTQTDTHTDNLRQLLLVCCGHFMHSFLPLLLLLLQLLLHHAHLIDLSTIQHDQHSNIEVTCVSNNCFISAVLSSSLLLLFLVRWSVSSSACSTTFTRAVCPLTLCACRASISATGSYHNSFIMFTAIIPSCFFNSYIGTTDINNFITP